MIRTAVLWVCFCLACSITGCSAAPSFINHTPPTLSVDFSPFADVGCPPDENGAMLCQPDSPLAAFDCDRIQETSDLLGGLEPGVPMALCLYESFRHSLDDYERTFQVEADGYVYRAGGLTPTYYRYVIYTDGSYQLLKTQAELKKAFAPIQSSTEALSYALASNGLSAYYGLSRERGVRYLSNKIEDTFVQQQENGYLVHLFSYRFFGCGPHTTTAHDLLVSPGGDIEAVKLEGMFEYPEEDDLCID